MKSLQLKVLSVVASALAVVGVAVAPQATAARRGVSRGAAPPTAWE